MWPWNQSSWGLAALGVLVWLQCCGAFWAPPQPKENIWVTLANKTGQDAICLALSSPGNPFSTCLVGIPLDASPCPEGVPPCQSNDTKGYADNWDVYIPHFPIAPLEPQELEILGSVKADWCIYFNWTGSYRVGPDRSKIKPRSVNSSLLIYRNQSVWCNYTSTSISVSSNSPITLPYGVFLICGDRAWAGVPSKIVGGPCTLGRLTLLTPNTSMILQIHRQHSRVKRMTHAFTTDCKDGVQFWSTTGTIFASIFPANVAAAKASAMLNGLGCWLAKQTNATSEALSQLLMDVDSIRHATLQNRAAIDFLLLAQGHGCEEFEGMCCMNLSDHSVSIHKQLQTLHTLTNNLQVNSGFGLDDWLRGLGLGPWLTSLLQHLITIGLVLMAIILIVPCLFKCLQNALMRMIDSKYNASLVVQKENGGSLESVYAEWLREKGHDETPLVKL
ncbi:syncytin-2-like [Excalfactoria chinensis]|uniref:syncytin-2-like n=1 Tax=Excalfactoria chinensis TaxID=46218 RepID=UPI003B3B495D